MSLSQHWRGDPRERPTPRRVFFCPLFTATSPSCASSGGWDLLTTKQFPPGSCHPLPKGHSPTETARAALLRVCDGAGALQSRALDPIAPGVPVLGREKKMFFFHLHIYPKRKERASQSCPFLGLSLGSSAEEEDNSLMRLAQHLQGHVGLYPNEIHQSYAPMGLEGVSLVRLDPRTSLWCPEVVAPCSSLGAPCPGRTSEQLQRMQYISPWGSR